MAVEPKDTKKWVAVPLDLGLTTNIEQDVFGTNIPQSGAIECHNIDFRSKKGSLSATTEDELLFELDGKYGIIKDIKQESDSSGGSDPYAVVTSAAYNSRISSFLAKGFKSLGGVEQDLIAPEGAQPDSDGMLQHDGKEVRVHCQTPKWYGIPRSVTEVTVDFPHDDITPSESIDEPFGDSNVIKAPTSGDFSIEVRDPLGVTYNNDDEQTMWGTTDENVNGHARYNHAYWAVSFVYDGYQESTLTRIDSNIADIGTFIKGIYPNANPLTTWALPITLNIKCVTFDDDGLVRLDKLSKRIRKIRLYCAPSVTESNNPLQELQFFLASEIEVDKADKSAYINGAPSRYNQPVERIENGGVTSGIRMAVHSGYAYDDFHSHHIYASYGMRFMIIGDPQETVFTIQTSDTYRYDDSDPNKWYIEFYIDPSQATLLEQAFASQGISDAGVQGSTTAIGTRTGSAFHHIFQLSTNNHLAHTNYIGSELLTRFTYEQLSGVSQNYQKTLSPPRRGGIKYNGTQVIWDVDDNDGKRHRNRAMYSIAAPFAGNTPDRFLPDKILNDFRGDIIGAAIENGKFVFFTKNSITIGSVEQDEIGWTLSDEKFGVGCVGRDTISESPLGVFFLSWEGVRILSGYTPSNPISDDIFSLFPHSYRSEWKYAQGFYDQRLRLYRLHFPLSQEVRFSTFVYDVDARKWSTEDSDSNYYGSGIGTDGIGLMGYIKPIGVYQYRESETKRTPQYKVKMDFGNPINKKRVVRFKSLHEGDLSLTIGSEDSTPTGDRTNGDYKTQDLVPTSGRVYPITLSDRAFDVTIADFEIAKAVWLEIQEVEDVAGIEIS